MPLILVLIQVVDLYKRFSYFWTKMKHEPFYRFFVKVSFLLRVDFSETHLVCIFIVHRAVLRTLAVTANFRSIPAVSTAEEHQEKSQDRGQRSRHAAG